RQLAGPDTRTLPPAAIATPGQNADFRGLPGNPIIYDPLTGDMHGDKKLPISCNGVANVICANRFDPASVYMMNLLKTSIGKEFGNDTSNFVGSGTALFNKDNADIKVTYRPSDGTSIFG